MQIGQAKENLGYLVAFNGEDFNSIAEQVIYGLELDKKQVKWFAPAGLNKGIIDVKNLQTDPDILRKLYKIRENNKASSYKSIKAITLGNARDGNKDIWQVGHFDPSKYQGRESTDGKEIITGDTVEGDDKPQTPDNQKYIDTNSNKSMVYFNGKLIYVDEITPKMLKEGSNNIQGVGAYPNTVVKSLDTEKSVETKPLSKDVVTKQQLDDACSTSSIIGNFTDDQGDIYIRLQGQDKPLLFAKNKGGFKFDGLTLGQLTIGASGV